jgi:hypothetical protein
MTEQTDLFGESTPVLKMCNMCGFRKPVEEFSPQRGGEFGRAHYCRKHASERTREWRQVVKAKRLAGELPGVTVKEKLCPKCGETKSSDDFGKNIGTASGLECWCKQCSSVAQTARRNDKERAAVLKKERSNRYRSRFGLDIDAMWKRQMGLCDACHLPMIAGGRGPMTVEVDHDHSCCDSKRKTCGNCVRGLLHSACNRAIGQVSDDAAALLRVAKYAIRKRGMTDEALREIGSLIAVMEQSLSD